MVGPKVGITTACRSHGCSDGGHIGVYTPEGNYLNFSSGFCSLRLGVF